MNERPPRSSTMELGDVSSACRRLVSSSGGARRDRPRRCTVTTQLAARIDPPTWHSKCLLMRPPLRGRDPTRSLVDLLPGRNPATRVGSAPRDGQVLGFRAMANHADRSWRIGVESRLLDRIRAGVIVTTLDGTVLYANPYCEVLYGRTPAGARRSVVGPVLGRAAGVGHAERDRRRAHLRAVMGGRLPRRAQGRTRSSRCTPSTRRCSTRRAR